MELPRTIAAIEETMRDGWHIGAQLCALHQGRVVADVAVGQARPGVPMTTEGVILWLSSSKPLTAVATMQLYEQGRITLDDPIARWIPEYAAHGKEAATIRHVLTHTAGTPWVETGWPGTPWEEIIRRICATKQPAEWIPGKQAGYSVINSWFVLAEIIRRIDGRRIHDYVREEILQPLGLANSWLAITPEAYRQLAGTNRLALMQTTGPARKVPYEWDTLAACTHPRPSGSGHGPIRELALFYEALRRGGELNGRRILKPQTVAEMTRRQRAGMKDRSFNQIVDWGLGIMVNSWQDSAHAALIPYQYGPHASRESFGHGGFQSSVGFCDPVNELCVGLVFNGCCGEEKHNQRAARVLALLYEELGLAN